MDITSPGAGQPHHGSNTPEERVVPPPQPHLHSSAQFTNSSHGRCCTPVMRLTAEAKDQLPRMSQARWYSITSCCAGAPQALFYFYGKWKAAWCPTNLCHVHWSTGVIKMTELVLGKEIQRSHTPLRTSGHYSVGEGIQLKFNKPHHPSQSSALILGGEASVLYKSAIRANVTCPSYKNCCVLERFCCHLQQQQDQSY